MSSFYDFCVFSTFWFVISFEWDFLVFFCAAVLAQGIDGSMPHSSRVGQTHADSTLTSWKQSDSLAHTMGPVGILVDCGLSSQTAWSAHYTPPESRDWPRLHFEVNEAGRPLPPTSITTPKTLESWACYSHVQPLNRVGLRAPLLSCVFIYSSWSLWPWHHVLMLKDENMLPQGGHSSNPATPPFHPCAHVSAVRVINKFLFGLAGPPPPSTGLVICSWQLAASPI